MKYSIWRIGPDGNDFELKTAGVTSIKEWALKKALQYNELLLRSEPEIQDRFVVRDEKGREIPLNNARAS